MPDSPVRQVGSLRFTAAPFSRATAHLYDLACEPKGVSIHFANAYTIALADEDSSYRSLLNGAQSIVFPDGTPVVWAGKLLERDPGVVWNRVYGPDVMTDLLRRSNHIESPVKHYLLGGSDETLAALVAHIRTTYPLARIAGTASPPFRKLSTQERRDQDARIIESGATCVWVGLGTPKQDWEAARLAAEVGMPVFAVGAAFDFLSGSKRQAPVWMQQSGLEWAFRMATEPRRLAKRYMWGNPKFVQSVLKHRR
ncbi:MAG: WecB/TagA/CpsF family glycosyltransferase [Actinobacteria bacterium]|nr:WecB/TagA/CpsF family glycosyltransferase [Actinomycetota bacterium]